MSWYGYYLLTINASQPQAVIDDCIDTIKLSGETLTTDYAHLKSVSRKSVDGLQYIVECSCLGDTPTLSRIKSDCLDGSTRTETEVNDLLGGVRTFTDAQDAIDYMVTNSSNWEEE